MTTMTSEKPTRRKRARESYWCKNDRHKGCALDDGIICGCKCHPREMGKVSDGMWQFELPMSTPLSLNDRSDHFVKARAVAQLRADAGWCAKEAKIAKCQKIRVTLIYEPRDKRRRDKDNLVATLKPAVDALVDIGVIPDDTPEHVEYDMPLIDEPNGKLGRLIVMVEKIL